MMWIVISVRDETTSDNDLADRPGIIHAAMYQVSM